jgi:broad specificity phosphatase PhoE
MLYIIRHAESEANEKGIYQGQSYDTGLTDRGRKQAQAVGEGLRKFQVDSIITSPSRRCKQTAQIIDYSNNRIIEQNKLLIEINHGTWEGKRINDFNKEESKILKQWLSEPHKTQMPDGEHFNDVVDRCKSIIKTTNNLRGNHAIITHDVITRILVLLVMDLAFEYFWRLSFDNCGITKIKKKPLRLISLNENTHLNGLGSDLNNQAL